MLINSKPVSDLLLKMFVIIFFRYGTSVNHRPLRWSNRAEFKLVIEWRLINFGICKSVVYMNLDQKRRINRREDLSHLVSRKWEIRSWPHPSHINIQLIEIDCWKMDICEYWKDMNGWLLSFTIKWSKNVGYVIKVARRYSIWFTVTVLV